MRSIFNALGTISKSTGTVTTVNLAANQTSENFAGTPYIAVTSYQFAIVSGTPNGSFIVDVSNDPRVFDPNFDSSAVWTPLPAVVFTSGLNNNNASCMVVVQNGALFSRCRWVSLDASAGTGWAMLSGVGAGG